MHTYLRLLLAVSAPEGLIPNEAVAAWLPEPEELGAIERTSIWMATRFSANLTALGARVYEKLGMLVEAKATAELGAKQHRKGNVVSDCLRTLGRVEAALGEVEAAGTHFLAAIDKATEQKWFMQALLAARDWKRSCGAADGAAETADAAIDAACSAMNKERAAFAALLC